MSEIRIPTQKRSIEKKDKIVEKGFELMCENGYFNTSTNDIAKYAGVSTGIIYQYFKFFWQIIQPSGELLFRQPYNYLFGRTSLPQNRFQHQMKLRNTGRKCRQRDNDSRMVR